MVQWPNGSPGPHGGSISSSSHILITCLVLYPFFTQPPTACKYSTSYCLASSNMSNLQYLVAHYLAQNYPSVAAEFCAAAHVSVPDLSQPPDPDLRTLVEDYISSSFARRIGDVGLGDGEEEPAQDGSWRGWKCKDIMRLPLKGSLGGIERVISGVTASNLLTVGFERLPTRRFDTSSARCV